MEIKTKNFNSAVSVALLPQHATATPSARLAQRAHRRTLRSTLKKVYTPAIIAAPARIPRLQVLETLAKWEIRTAQAPAPAVQSLRYPHAWPTHSAAGWAKIQPAGAPELVYSTADTAAPGTTKKAVQVECGSFTIEKNHPGICADSAPYAYKNEYGASDAAKNSVGVRFSGNVADMAIRASIAAVKNAIAPKGKDIHKSEKITITKNDDGAQVLPSVGEKDVDKGGAWTDTLRSALVSLQAYAHSATAVQPENPDAQEILSVATLAILERAQKIGVSAEDFATGYNPDGTPIVRVISGGADHGKLRTGYVAALGFATSAVLDYVRKQRTHDKNTVSLVTTDTEGEEVDGMDFLPDAKALDKLFASVELSPDMMDAIKSTAKTPDIQGRRVKVAQLLIAGYKYDEIAPIFGKSKMMICKDVAAMRKALALYLR